MQKSYETVSQMAPRMTPEIIKNPSKWLPGSPMDPQEVPRCPGWLENQENWSPELQNATQNHKFMHHIWLPAGLCSCPLLCCFLYVVVGSLWVCVRVCVRFRACVVVVAALLGCVMPSGGAGGRGRSPLDNCQWFVDASMCFCDVSFLLFDVSE